MMVNALAIRVQMWIYPDLIQLHRIEKAYSFGMHFDSKRFLSVKHSQLLSNNLYFQAG